jgi:hypothetical protein
MSAYPPEWQIHSESEFEAFHLAPGEDGAMGMVLQAKLNRSGNFNGVFQCCIFGANPTTIHVPASRIILGLPDEFHSLKFAFSVNPEEIAPQTNSTCTVWKDALASVMDRTLLVLDADDNVVDPAQVIKYFKDTGDAGGFSTRWAVAATPSTNPPTLQAELQMLPVAAKYLTKANLKADNAVSVQLARIPLRVEMFDGVDAAGPIPTLFAADRDSAFQNLMNNLQEVLEGVNNLNQRFLYMEHLSLDEATKYLQGQAKKAKGIPAFKPHGDCLPPAKKTKSAGAPAAPPANTAASSTGTNLMFFLLLGILKYFF